MELADPGDQDRTEIMTEEGRARQRQGHMPVTSVEQWPDIPALIDDIQPAPARAIPIPVRERDVDRRKMAA
jgi:hypothetical protein